MYDLAIIGGGPAGVAAGVYAARKQLKTVFITEAIGGQSVDSMDVQNWIGTVEISGIHLAKAFEAHLKAYAGGVVDLKIGERVIDLEKEGDHFLIVSNKASYEAHAVLIASGGSRKKLQVPGALLFENKGVTYCASCDGPLFGGQDVVVVGGGNAGFETAAQLLAYAKSVTLVHRNEEFKADPMTVKKVLAHPYMRSITCVEPAEVKGEKFMKSVVLKNRKTGEITEIPATGLFVEIGMLPSTDFAKKLVKLDQIGRIVTNPKDQKTSVPGIWAAGDCTDELYHQNNIAAGDAVKALEDIYMNLKAK